VNIVETKEFKEFINDLEKYFEKEMEKREILIIF
jgi:hypothetical protein